MGTGEGMKKVLCIAEACCDIIFGKLDRIPRPGEEEYCRHFSIKAGGGANTAMGLARLNIPVTLLTRLGDDEMGHIVLNSLAASGLDRNSFRLEKGIRTPVSAVMSTKEDRCFASFSGDGGRFVTDEQLEKEIMLCDHVHTYLGYCLDYPIPSLCKKYGKTLSLDSSWLENMDLKALEPVLSCCSLFTPNEKEALALTGADCAEEALSILSKIVPNTVITLGKEGSIALIGERIHRQECISYGPPADSTGAGDLYCSGLLYGFINGLDLRSSMEIASHTAGLCVTYYGGIDEIFTAERFEAILKNTYPNWANDFPCI